MTPDMEAENQCQNNQQELYNQKESYRALTENSPDIIMRFDRQYRHLFVNSRVEEILGIPHQVFINKTHKELGFPKHQYEYFDKAIEVVFQTGKDHHVELDLENGIWLDWILFPEFDKAGNVIAVTTSARDISELKQMEAQLIKAKDDAEEAARAKSDFLATMGHEIKTPMNAIIALTHLMQKTDLDDRQYNYIKKIDQSSETLLGIINDILDFSKIEAGKLNMDHIEFNLNQVLDQVFNSVLKKADEKQLTLSADIQEETPTTLIGDPLRLGQILLNLVSNAIKFTDQGEVAIIVERMNGIENDTTLKFSVKDTGIGLSEEQQKKLFTSFQQIDTTNTRKYGGTGLGLAISKKLTEMMGGEIGVTSKTNSGSTFFFTAHFGVPKEIKSTPVKKAHILLVEDNEILREVIEELLKKQGYQVDLADNGAEAISFINHKKDEEMYNAILMELQMPVMDGATAATILREYPRFNNLPIIALTDTNNEINDGVEAPFDAYITKPIQSNTLLDNLVQWTNPERKTLNRTVTRTTEKPSKELNLKGIDTQSALTRMNGNMDGYKRILNKFAASESDFTERLQTTLLSNNREEAIRMAHTLKGVSGNIGAMDLFKSAAELEELLKNSDHPRVEIILMLLNEQLTEVLDAIREGVNPAMEYETPRIDTSQVKDILSQLSVQIDEFDASASETCNELSRCLKRTETAPMVAGLQKALENYNFAAAEACLLQIKRILIH